MKNLHRLIVIVMISCFLAESALAVYPRTFVHRRRGDVTFLDQALSPAQPELNSGSALRKLLAEVGFKHFSETEPVDGLKHKSLKLFDGLNVVILDRPASPMYDIAAGPRSGA